MITNGFSGPLVSAGAGGASHSYHVEGSLPLVVNTNAAYHIFLGASVGSVQPSDTGWAYTDPYIRIDEGWLATHPGYSVNVTPGVLNQVTMAVPEPAMSVLFAFGLAVLFGATRQRPAAGERLAGQP